MSGQKSKNLIALSLFFSAGAAIAYEILGASALVNLLGASVYYFSLVIGIFLAALGIGGWFSSRIKDNLFEKIIIIEIILALLGGGLSAFVFGGYAFIFEFFGAVDFDGVSGFLKGLLAAKLAFLSFSLFLIFAIGVLAGFELPLFSRIVAQREVLKDALGKVFFWDYAGSLLISVSLPLFFLSQFGIIKTSFLMGLFNAFAALFLTFALRQYAVILKPILKFGILFAIIVNALGFLGGETIELFLEKKQYGDREILHHSASPYQRLSFVLSKNGAVSLYLNGQRQFESGEWDAVYHESFVHPAMSVAKNRGAILVLGGGDGLALREILKYPEVKSVTLVDIDRAMVDAAKELNAMKSLNRDSFFDPRVRVVIDDAFTFVKERNHGDYDAVFVDFPDPSDESLSRLYSKEFYLMLGKMITRDGVITIQSSAYQDNIQRIILKTLQAAGLNALAYHPPQYDLFDQNFGFTLAAKRELKKEDFEGASVTVSTSTFKNVSLAGIFNSAPVPKKSRQLPKVNSLFHPVIFKAYGDVFIQHYLESRPKDEILAHLTLPREAVYRELENLFYEPYNSPINIP